MTVCSAESAKTSQYSQYSSFPRVTSNRPQLPLPTSSPNAVNVSAKQVPVLHEMMCAIWKSRIPWTGGRLPQVWQTTQAPGFLVAILKHCNSARRASTCQHGATPHVSSATLHFALKGRYNRELWNPFRVRARTKQQPGAAFIRNRGFSCPRLICGSLSG